ncbi:MAG: hypothetical protein IPI97_13790 [Nitrosomonas sp.]|nr:hypothetical protein [Nitrosomonas sp.]
MPPALRRQQGRDLSSLRDSLITLPEINEAIANHLNAYLTQLANFLMPDTNLVKSYYSNPYNLNRLYYYEKGVIAEDLMKNLMN